MKEPSPPIEHPSPSTPPSTINSTPPSPVKISKLLSYLLRHAALEKNLPIAPDGYVPLTLLLNLPEFSNYSLNEHSIIKIVNSNNKNRFQLTSRDNQLLIRAVQGHSINTISNLLLLSPISLSDSKKYPLVVHGTFYHSWLNCIKTTGLSKMSRNHIHFAIGYPNHSLVISGIRSNCNVFIEIDLHLALLNGISFYLSNNNVILSEGLNGIIPPIYFKNVSFLQ